MSSAAAAAAAAAAAGAEPVFRGRRIGKRLGTGGWRSERVVGRCMGQRSYVRLRVLHGRDEEKETSGFKCDFNV
nr:unnamed protein product [Digitaria exilis]